MTDQDTGPLMGLTADIVAAYISHNQVTTEALPSLIQAVYRSLSTAGKPEAEAIVTPTPAVSVKKSVFPDFLVCLEDGKKLKMLKRHLQTSYGMTPADYRMKWGLPRDYPMVAPNYATTRSTLAKQIGLGRKQGQRSIRPEPKVEVEVEVEVTQLPARRAHGSRK